MKHLPEQAAQTPRILRRLLVVLLCVTLALTSTGCSFFSRDGAPYQLLHGLFHFLFEDDVTDYDENPNVYPNAGPVEALDINEARPEGSALELWGDVILIGVFMDNPKDPWTDKDLDRVEKNMTIACDWLEGQATEYGIDLDLHYGEPDTIYHIKDTGLTKAAATEKEEVSFNRDLSRYLANLDTEAICEKYGTDNVGYLLFLHDDYGAYTWPYTRTGSELDRYFYYECCCLFLYDGTGEDAYENPATYAHEILHLFGASDLYMTSKEEGIDQALLNYIETYYPDELMLYTYEDDNTSNYEEITKELSPFTRYFIGWQDGEEILKDWPKIEREVPGAFNPM